MFLLAFVVAGSAVIAQIPVSELAGITAWMGISLTSWSHWKRLTKMRRIDIAAFFCTCAGVLLFNAVAAILIGTSLYLVRLIDTKYLPEIGGRKLLGGQVGD